MVLLRKIFKKTNVLFLEPILPKISDFNNLCCLASASKEIRAWKVSKSLPSLSVLPSNVHCVTGGSTISSILPKATLFCYMVLWNVVELTVFNHILHKNQYKPEHYKFAVNRSNWLLHFQSYICVGHAAEGRTVTIRTNHFPSMLHSHGHAGICEERWIQTFTEKLSAASFPPLIFHCSFWVRANTDWLKRLVWIRAKGNIGFTSRAKRDVSCLNFYTDIWLQPLQPL